MRHFFPPLPYSYHFRSLFRRRASTALNLFAILVTILVFLVMNGMVTGLKNSLQSTGRENVVVMLTQGADTAEVSKLPADFLPTVRYYPTLAKRPDDSPLLSPESYTVKPLKPKSGGNHRWIPIRGIEPINFDLYQDLFEIRGSPLLHPQEVLVGDLVRLKMGNLQIGDQIQIGRQLHKIVGFFTAKGSAFESELWISRNDFKVDFNVEYDSILVGRFNSMSDRDRFVAQVEKDQRLRLDVKTEREYFSSLAQSATALQLIASIIAVILSIAAVFTGMNALYASIASRTIEIGTLRSMGFGQTTILFGFLLEGLAVSLIAGFLALLLSIPFEHLPISYFRSSFRIQIPFSLIGEGLLLALAVGLIGSWIPARRAAGLKIVQSLR